MFCVYCHTNKANGKKYVGITSQEPEKRWSNGRGYRYNEHFTRAINKYGWDGFYHEILYENLSSKEASEKEIALIKKFNTANPEHGYNHSLGGEHNEGGITEETRQKLRIANSRRSEKAREIYRNTIIAYNKSDKHRRDASESAKRRSDEIREIFSRYWHNSPSKETKKKLSEQHKKPVMCIETGEIFDCAASAAMSVGLKRNAVSNVVNGIAITAGGKHFVLVDEKRELKLPQKKCKSVKCMETGEVFESAEEAANKFGTCRSNINHCANGRYKHAKGFTFSYVD